MLESIHGPQRALGSEGSALEKGQAGGGPRSSVGVGRETERLKEERALRTSEKKGLNPSSHQALPVSPPPAPGQGVGV